MEHPDHCFFLHSKDRAFGHRGRRGHAKRLPREASFTKEISAPQDCDDRFLPPLREDRQLHLALLNVKHRVRGITLGEDGALLSIILRGSATGFRKVHPEIEWRVFFLCHESAPTYPPNWPIAIRTPPVLHNGLILRPNVLSVHVRWRHRGD